MRDDEWRAIFGKLLADAEKELADFTGAIANHGLRILHRDTEHGERDVTEDCVREIQERIEEYRNALRG